MWSRNVILGTLAAMSFGLVLEAQSSQNPPAPQSKPAAAGQQAQATLTGCVYRERDVPGRAPNVAERLGVLEDYILVASGTAGVPGQAPGAPASVGTSGSTVMYKLEHIDDDVLKTFVGKRVEATGRIDAEEGDQAGPRPGERSSDVDKVIGRDNVDLAEFEVSAIKAVAGTCPATPASVNP